MEQVISGQLPNPVRLLPITLYSRVKTFIIQEDKDNDIKSVSIDSGSDCIAVTSNR